MIEELKTLKDIEIPRNTKIKEFKCKNCIAYIKYIDGETKEVHCPLCKTRYNISNFELITEEEENLK